MKLVREVGVIVVGVLLALGADALYGRVQDREEALRYRAGLEEDLRADSVSLARLLGPPFSGQAAATDTLRELLAPGASDPGGATVLRLLRTSIMLPSGNKSRATFDEMVSSGDLDLLDDAQLRRALVAYYSAPLVVIDTGMFSTWMSGVYWPWVAALNSVFGANRAFDMGQCSSDECFSEVAQGDEFALLRASPRLEELVGGMDFMEYFATLPAAAQLTFVHELLTNLRSQRTAP